MLNRRKFLSRPLPTFPGLGRRSAWRKAGFIPRDPDIDGSPLIAPLGTVVAAMIFGLAAFSVAGETGRFAGEVTRFENLASTAPTAEGQSTNGAPTRVAEANSRLATIWAAGLTAPAPAHAQHARPYGRAASDGNDSVRSVRLTSEVDWASGIVLPDDKVAIMEELASETGTYTP
jgi:hypothetical protein